MESASWLLAGIFAGVSVTLGFVVAQLSKLYRKTDAERMRLWNKLLVRDGQTTLFTTEQIEGKEQEPAQPGAVATIMSPVRRQRSRLRQNLAERDKREAGNRLPPEMKASIAAAAEKLRNGTDG